MQGLLLCKLPYKIPQKLVSQCIFIKAKTGKMSSFGCQMEFVKSVKWKWPILKQKNQWVLVSSKFMINVRPSLNNFKYKSYKLLSYGLTSQLNAMPSIIMAAICVEVIRQNLRFMIPRVTADQPTEHKAKYCFYKCHPNNWLKSLTFYVDPSYEPNTQVQHFIVIS